MIIGSSYNLKNKVVDKNILINNVQIPRTNKFTYLVVTMDERLSYEKRIDSICSKFGVRNYSMRRVKPFVPLPTLKMLYHAIVLYSLISIIVARYGIIAE